MAGAVHALIKKFKPRAFGHHYELFQDTITYGGEPRSQTSKSLAGVTCTNATVNGHTNATIEVKRVAAAAWTFGVVKVGRTHRTKAAAFKVLIDAAVAAVAPAITSGNSKTIQETVPGSFTVTTTGTPAPAITCAGVLPTGVTFVDNGGGTATLAGTPIEGGFEGSPYALVITANNGTLPNATQAFTLTISEGP